MLVSAGKLTNDCGSALTTSPDAATDSLFPVAASAASGGAGPLGHAPSNLSHCLDARVAPDGRPNTTHLMLRMKWSSVPWPLTTGARLHWNVSGISSPLTSMLSWTGSGWLVCAVDPAGVLGCAGGEAGVLGEDGMLLELVPNSLCMSCLLMKDMWCWRMGQAGL